MKLLIRCFLSAKDFRQFFFRHIIVSGAALVLTYVHPDRSLENLGW